MKKWEYKVTYSLVGVSDDELSPSGRDGWECYAVVPDKINSLNITEQMCAFFLKRELVDSKQVIL